MFKIFENETMANSRRGNLLVSHTRRKFSTEQTHLILDFLQKVVILAICTPQARNMLASEL